MAIAVTEEPDTRVRTTAAAVVIGALGVDALISARRGRRSLLSRIGPLP